MIKEVGDIIKAIGEAESFVIATHISPEGDAIGSELGLALSLIKMGKRVSVLNTDPVPEFLHFLPGTELVQRVERVDAPHDVLIVVDCEPARTGLKDLDKAPVKMVINIDHHVTNPKTADINWVDPEAAAAGEMVYDLLVAMHAPIDTAVATNLYTAIFTDTGSFRYSNTDEPALVKSGQLMKYGVSPWEISENVYETKTFGRMKLLGLVLAGIEINGEGSLGWVTIYEDYYKKTGTSAEDTDGFINYPRAIKGVEVAILFREAGAGRVKLSFRSKGRVDVSRLAASLGGGGHPNAAGVHMDGSVEEVKAKVLPAVEKLVKEALSA